METAQSEAEKTRQSARRLEDELVKAKKAVEKDRAKNSPAPLSHREQELQIEITQLMVSQSCVRWRRTLRAFITIRLFCAARHATTNYEHMSL